MVAAGVGVYSQGESPGEPEESAEAVKMLLDARRAGQRRGQERRDGAARSGLARIERGGDAAGQRRREARRPQQPRLAAADDRRRRLHQRARHDEPHTAKLLRELMNARGLDTTEEGTNFGGAMRDRRRRRGPARRRRTRRTMQRTMLEQQQKRGGGAEARSRSRRQVDATRSLRGRRGDRRPRRAGGRAAERASERRAAATTRHQGVPVATNTIVAEPDAYYGKLVTVSAGVEQMLSKTTFLVDQWKAAGPNEVLPIGKPILVIAPYLTASARSEALPVDARQIVKFDPAAIARVAADYKLDLAPEIGAKYLGQPVLVATSVLNSTYVELARKPIPPPSPAELALTAAMKTISPAFAALRAAAEESKADVVTQNAGEAQAGVHADRSNLGRPGTELGGAVGARGARPHGVDGARRRRRRLGRGQDVGRQAQPALPELPRHVIASGRKTARFASSLARSEFHARSTFRVLPRKAALTRNTAYGLSYSPHYSHTSRALKKPETD